LLNHLRRRFGSRDYLSCPADLRAMFVAVVSDDTTPLLPHLTTPALLLYGAEDEETPPDVGRTLARLLPRATLEILPHLNHYTILTHGQHVVQQRLQGWLKTLGA
jgi:pimeloyl-ACP methyl ester carboxylesterase